MVCIWPRPLLYLYLTNRCNYIVMLYVTISRLSQDTAPSQLESYLASYTYVEMASYSDIILLGTTQLASSLQSIQSVNVAGTPVPTSGNIRSLGVTHDKSLSFNSYISNLSKSCFYHSGNIRPAI